MAKPEFAKNTGIDPEWKLFGTGPSIVDAFESGAIDIAYIGLPPAIIGIERGVPIKCLAGGHIEGTVISGKRPYKGYPEISDIGTVMSQFRGQKIGVPGNGSIHDVILNDSLNRYNLSGDIEIVNFPWADLVVEAFVRDEIAAAIGTPALAVAVRDFAEGRILLPPSKLWPNNPSYGILVNSAFLKREIGSVEAFLILHEEATSFLRNKPAEASELISNFVGFIDSKFVLDTLMVSPKYCAQITGAYISSTMEFVKALLKLGYIRRELNSDEIFDISLIRKIHPGADHYEAGISDIKY